MILINGKKQQTIEVTDRGLAYGDGLFETIAIASGRPVYWNRHVRRLLQGCKVLGLACPAEELLKQELLQLVSDQKKGVVKIILTRGSGGRGYRPDPSCGINRILSFHSWPEINPEYYSKGIALYPCTTPVSSNSRLAGLKTLCRLEQVMAQSEFDEPDYAEGVMLDDNGMVIECSKTNIFIVSQDRLYSPSLKRSGIKGIMRDVIIDLAGRLGISFTETELDRSDLLKADEIFVCNSIIKIWPVREYLANQYPVGEITKTLMLEIEKES